MTRSSIAVSALKKAGAFLKTQVRVVCTGQKKEDGTLVSEADHGAEQIIISILKKAFPKDGILSEESPELAGKSGYRWILDPLDGTHNFLAGIPLFGTLLALEQAGEIVWSACFFPVLGEFFLAEKGKGAFLNGEKIHVSSARDMSGGVFLTDGNSLLDPALIARDIEKIKICGCRYRMLGSGPFGMTRVAFGGALAAVLRRGKPWDLAAPALLVEEAGGRVTDAAGKPWSLECATVVATNGKAHKESLSFFA